jgi:RNA polymerase sigma-70 factor (ECF subfamily)
VAGEEWFDAALARAAQGEPDGLAALYRAFHPMVLRFLKARGGVLAEDLASELWISVARSLPRFSGSEADFRAWLFSIARRRIVDHHRREVRRPPTTSLEITDDTATPGADVVVSEAMASQDAVDWLVQVLSGDQADVVLLRVVAGLSVEETAGVMSRPTTWVRVTQHRALRKLAERGVAEIGVTP